MTYMLWTLFALLFISGIVEAAATAAGGKKKSAALCAFDSVLNFSLAGWILWFLAK